MEIRVRHCKIDRRFNVWDKVVTLKCPGLIIKKPWKTHEWTSIPNDNLEFIGFNEDLFITEDIVINKWDLNNLYLMSKRECATIILNIDENGWDVVINRKES